MLELRQCSDGKWVFDRGEYVEFINSKRHAKVYTCAKGRYIRQGMKKVRIYIKPCKEEK